MATSKGTQWAPGDVVVLVNLPVHVDHPGGEKTGPKVGQIVRITGDEVRVRLHIGRAFSSYRHFAKLARTCKLANIARRATEREAAIGSRVLIETFDGKLAAVGT